MTQTNDTLPSLPLDFFDVWLLKSAILCRLASLRGADQPQQRAGESIRQLRAVYRQLQGMQQRGAEGSDLLTGSALQELDDALGEYIAATQQRGVPSAEPDEILANLYRLRQSLQPLLPPLLRNADDPSEGS